MKKETTIGLFGFGVVGEGLYQLLLSNQITKTHIKHICIRDPHKPRSLDGQVFCFNPDTILNDEKVNLVIELTNDDQGAYNIVKNALRKGKSVVSGNKKVVAHHLEEFMEIQEQTGSALLYDASACGSIPVIRNLEEYYDNDLLKSISGILNGSSNFILSRMFNHDESYASSLSKAQELGYAESDPTSDVDGLDALYKLVIIATHGFGTYVHPGNVFSFGISAISGFDIDYARNKDCRIKLIAHAVKLQPDRFTLFVMPRLVNPEEYVFNVEDEFNGVVIEGECYDKQFMFGKGAGGFPTAASVLSDITARSYDYRYEYKKKNYFRHLNYTTDCEVEIYLRYREASDFNLFDFETISERYSSLSNHYVVGTIMLDKLISVQEDIGEKEVFIAFTGNIDG
ncbi:MAG: homoserine dehydrogenase [Bacteroidales bacterium]|nr:homoserine dehydrogenase [Bacteroidales bacterium]